MKIKISYLLICLLFSILLQGKTIDILVRWDLQEVYNQHWSLLRQKGYEVRVFSIGFGNSDAKVREYIDKHYSPNTQKIIVMEDFIPREILSSLGKENLILFMWEPIGKTEDGSYYSYVYTFNDDLVGTKNYRKFVYPHLMASLSSTLPFEEKKMCAAVISHWLPERARVVDFFKQAHPDSFDLYGNNGGPFTGSTIYKGRIPGHHSASPKLHTLQRYKFVLAFENSSSPQYGIPSGYFAPGYITEKIFGILAAGAVPIYLGPENIDLYIPKSCFISYKDFSSPEQLYNYISSISKEVYEQYLQNIKEYLQSAQAQLFSPAAFEYTILEAAES